MEPETLSFVPRTERPMLVLTSVDGTLRDDAAASCAPARQALDILRSRGVPVILTSHHSGDELVALQGELGLRAPFIAENGRALHVPAGYFPRLPQPGVTSAAGWEVMEFTPPSVEEAIEMLMWLYRVSGESPLLVGVGASWTDHVLLRHVDVPVVVSNPALDQRGLRMQFPDAYVTASPGPAGWSEAILG